MRPSLPERGADNKKGIRMKHEQAHLWLKSVLRHHLASNARTYSYAAYTHEPQRHGTFGYQVDPKAQEGKVVEVSDEWLLLKTGRNSFYVIDKTLMDCIPDRGATVRVRPYARRRFDGCRLDAPEKSENGFTTFVIGKRISRLPIDKTTLRSFYLRELITQIEEMSAGDGFRTIAQALIDAGAHLEPVAYQDPADEEAYDKPASLTFRIKSNKHDGHLQIQYDLVIDYYVIRLLNADGSLKKECKDVGFDQLADVIVSMVDDGRWRIAHVEILKPAPKACQKRA